MRVAAAVELLLAALLEQAVLVAGQMAQLPIAPLLLEPPIQAVAAAAAVLRLPPAALVPQAAPASLSSR
jgi:hypothetical protein